MQKMVDFFTHSFCIMRHVGCGNSKINGTGKPVMTACQIDPQDIIYTNLGFLKLIDFFFCLNYISAVYCNIMNHGNDANANKKITRTAAKKHVGWLPKMKITPVLTVEFCHFSSKKWLIFSLIGFVLWGMLGVEIRKLMAAKTLSWRHVRLIPRATLRTIWAFLKLIVDFCLNCNSAVYCNIMCHGNDANANNKRYHNSG